MNLIFNTAWKHRVSAFFQTGFLRHDWHMVIPHIRSTAHRTAAHENMRLTHSPESDCLLSCNITQVPTRRTENKQWFTTFKPAHLELQMTTWYPPLGPQDRKWVLQTTLSIHYKVFQTHSPVKVRCQNHDTLKVCLYIFTSPHLPCFSCPNFTLFYLFTLYSSFHLKVLQGKRLLKPIILSLLANH